MRASEVRSRERQAEIDAREADRVASRLEQSNTTASAGRSARGRRVLGSNKDSRVEGFKIESRLDANPTDVGDAWDRVKQRGLNTMLGSDASQWARMFPGSQWAADAGQNIAYAEMNHVTAAASEKASAQKLAAKASQGIIDTAGNQGSVASDIRDMATVIRSWDRP